MLMPGQRAGIVKSVGCVDVSLYSKHWPCLLPQHGPGGNTSGGSRSNPGSKPRRPGHRRVRPRPDPQRRLPRRRQRPRGHAASATTSRTDPRTSSACSPPHSTSSASTGRGRPSTSCPSTERPIRPVWTSSSARRPARYRWKVSTTRRRRPALIALVIVGAAGCLALAWWQWTRFESASGTFLNLGYALQWPLFAGFVVYAYYKFVRYEEAPPEPKRARCVTEIPAGLLPERPKPATNPTMTTPCCASTTPTSPTSPRKTRNNRRHDRDHRPPPLKPSARRCWATAYSHGSRASGSSRSATRW